MPKLSETTNLNSAQFKEQSGDPASPASGQHTLYAKSGGFYTKSSAGVVTALGAATVTRVNATAQTANIAATSFSGTYANGLYRVNWYLLATAFDLSAGYVRFAVNWNDGVTARSYTGLEVYLTDNGQFDNMEQVIYIGNATAPTYSVTATGIYGTAQYALHAMLEAL